MKKNNKIRSKAVKESLLDYNNLATTLKENTEDAVKNLLSETVRDTYAKLLSEDNDDDYDEEEVDDTDSGTTADDANPDDTGAESDSSVDDDADDDTDDDDIDTQADEDSDDDADDDVDDDSVETDTEDATDDEDGDDWAQFDKYKVADGEYDFSKADDDEIVKVYKLLKDDDQVLVHNEGGKVDIKDNETGAEYLVDLGGDEAQADDDAEDETNPFEDADSEFEDNEEDNMNESTERIFEIALNEYDSNVGYTDNYQSKDAMTTPDMSEPGKNVRDWDAGVPKGKSKPWSGYPGKKQKADKPFNGGKGKTVEEDDELEEATNVGGFVQQNSTSKSHVPNSSGRNARSASKGGVRIKGTVDPRYDGNEANDVKNESIMRKANKIYTENKQLKQALGKFRNVLQEAAVTNMNLGQIIKLISENSTSQDEKKEIIARFGKEAKTIEQSKNLYESISNALKKANKMNLTESTLSATGSKKINETPIYKSNDLMESLDLMHRVCK